MKPNQKSFFSSAKEQRAAMGLLVLVVCFLLIRWGISSFTGSKPNTILITESAEALAKSGTNQTKANSIEYNPSTFDPNTASIEVLQQQGIPLWLAKRIINYRTKGGKFRTKADLQRIYDFPDSLFQKVVSYIQLPDSAEKNYTKYPQKEYYKRYPTHTNKQVCATGFNINKAGLAELDQLPGIGEARAKWILDYRDRLGGFTDLRQLEDMVGLDSLSLASLKQYAQIFPDDLPRKLNINLIDLEELAKHPYLTRRKAKAIINFRTQHGAYQDIDELTSVRVLTDKELEKIRPYLSTE